MFTYLRSRAVILIGGMALVVLILVGYTVVRGQATDPAQQPEKSYLPAVLCGFGCTTDQRQDGSWPPDADSEDNVSAALVAERHAADMIHQGRHTFRFDTFGDEAFWGDTLQLHQAIEGKNLGGV